MLLLGSITNVLTLTYAHVCSRMLTYADLCMLLLRCVLITNMLMLTYADPC